MKWPTHDTIYVYFRHANRSEGFSGVRRKERGAIKGGGASKSRQYSSTVGRTGCCMLFQLDSLAFAKIFPILEYICIHSIALLLNLVLLLVHGWLYHFYTFFPPIPDPPIPTVAHHLFQLVRQSGYATS